MFFHSVTGSPKIIEFGIDFSISFNNDDFPAPILPSIMKNFLKMHFIYLNENKKKKIFM